MSSEHNTDNNNELHFINKIAELKLLENSLDMYNIPKISNELNPNVNIDNIIVFLKGLINIINLVRDSIKHNIYYLLVSI